jgi:hypothetical protein
MKLFFILLSISALALPIKGNATPITERTTLDAVEVFEIKPGDRKFVCARFAGDAAELTAGSIDGPDFVPARDKIASLKRRIRKASGAKRERLQRQLRTLQSKMKRCRNEGALSPLVVEEFGCGHILYIDECIAGECLEVSLQMPRGAGASVAAAFDESLQLCELYKTVSLEYEERFHEKFLSDRPRVQLGANSGCSLFTCGITPEGRSWNIYEYSAAGVLTACKPGNLCEEFFVESNAMQPSWELARQVSVANCDAEMEKLANGLLAFDGYVSAATSVACYPTVFDRKLGLK